MFWALLTMPSNSKKTEENQRRRPKQARSIAKYNAVLDACSRVLSTHTYAQITMTEFCLESGLPYATIYQYFENKDDIMLAWMARLFDQVEALVASQKDFIESKEGKGAKAKSGDLSEHVNGLILTSLSVIAANQASMRELMAGMPQMLTSKLLTVAEDRTVKMVNKLYEQNIAESVFPDLEYHLRIITKMLIGFLLQSILSGREAMDAKKDSAEIGFLVNAYLSGRGIVG